LRIRLEHQCKGDSRKPNGEERGGWCTEKYGKDAHQGYRCSCPISALSVLLQSQRGMGVRWGVGFGMTF